MAKTTLYWYDFETTGTDPARDRPLQFAGLRTDPDLNPVEPPQLLYCRPATDLLPHPQAVLITGITPQKAAREGLREVEFIDRIHQVFAQPGTCVVGYNTLRFDDEVTRHTLYRNLFDPYAREWQNGNSRWDLIDVARMARALRPEGMVWPDHPDGRPSFRLEDLTAANGIDHGDAHDALADVRATLALAQRLRRAQPRLFAYLFGLRRKKAVVELLQSGEMRPLVLVSGRLDAARDKLTIIAPVAPHPHNANEVIVVDLCRDPSPLWQETSDTLRQRLFTPGDRQEGAARPPLRTVRLNRCPALAPLATLRPQDIERLGLDLNRCARHREQLLQVPDLAQRLRAVFTQGERGRPRDPELALYSGGFLGDADRERLLQVHRLPPERLGREAPSFDDPRLQELLFRLRARNWPHTLGPVERLRWERLRRRRLTDPGADAGLTAEAYLAELAELHQEGRDPALLEALRAWLYRLLGPAETAGGEPSDPFGD